MPRALLDLTPAGGEVKSLLAPGASERLGAARTRGAVRGGTGGAIAWVLVERGEGELRAGDATTVVAGRDDVFSAPGWSALVPPGCDLSIEGGDIEATVVWRTSERDGEPRVIDPASVADQQRGEGASARRVRTYVGAGALIVGETLNPPGGWSSWPPHRHDHEEIYLYRFDPSHGFGVHVAYDDDGDRPVIVRDGSIERITSGWHPVVAAPGFIMYYLWALAGDADTVDTRLDPRYADAS
jgi:5-deoxy-glucuronate isomerase